MAASGFSLLTFNIGDPSDERACRQLAWLAGRGEHVLVLTEIKASSGCQLLADAFAAAGYLYRSKTRRMLPDQRLRGVAQAAL